MAARVYDAGAHLTSNGRLSARARSFRGGQTSVCLCVCQAPRWGWRCEIDESTMIEHDELVPVLECLQVEQVSAKRKTSDKGTAGGGHLVNRGRCRATGGFSALIQKKFGARQIAVAKAVSTARKLQRSE